MLAPSHSTRSALPATRAMSAGRSALAACAVLLGFFMAVATAYADPRDGTGAERGKKAPARKAPKPPKPPARLADAEDAIDLLDGLNVETGTRLGTWTLADEGLRCTGDGVAKIVLGDAHDGEYDYRIDFTRESGAGRVAQLLSHGDRSIGWVMGVARNDGTHFIELNRGANRSNMATKQIENGQRYTALVCVRKDAVTAFIDGEHVKSVALDGFAAALAGDAAIEKGKLALLAGSPTVFHSAELIPLLDQKPGRAKKPAKAEDGPQAGGKENAEPEEGESEKTKPGRLARRGGRNANAAAGDPLPQGSTWTGNLSGNTRLAGPCTMKVVDRTNRLATLRVHCSGGGVIDWYLAVSKENLVLEAPGVVNRNAGRIKILSSRADGGVIENEIRLRWSWTEQFFKISGQPKSTIPCGGTLQLVRDQE